MEEFTGSVSNLPRDEVLAERIVRLAGRWQEMSSGYRKVASEVKTGRARLLGKAEAYELASLTLVRLVKEWRGRDD